MTPHAQRRRLFLIALVLLGVVLLVAGWMGGTRAAGGRYLARHAGADWIVPGAVKIVGVMPVQPTLCTFERTIEISDSAPQPLTIELRTLGTWRAKVGSQPLGVEFQAQPAGVYAARVEGVRPGATRVAVQVFGEMGPVALWCRVADAGGVAVAATDDQWLYSINGSAQAQARVADSRDGAWIADSADPFELEKALVWGMPWATGLLAALGLGAFLWGFSGKGVGQKPTRRQYWLTVLGAMGVWTVLLGAAAAYLPPETGFDARGHVQYIDYVRTHGRVPLANEGWQMYQAPAYYLLSGGLLKALGLPALSTGGVLVLRLINWAMAMGFLAASAGALERFCHRRYDRAGLAFLLLASCPVCFYLFCYFTNENMLTLMTAAVFLAYSRVRGRGADSWGRAATLGLALGLALLSKVSAVMLLALILGGYGLRALGQVNRGGWKKGLSAGIKPMAVAAGAFVVAGWYYVYVWRNLGSPIVGNWDAASGQVWWQEPGYRTWASYVPGLRVLAEPIYAGFNDIWSGVWATWAGDSLLGGATMIDYRPGWNYWVFPVSMIASLALFALALCGGFKRISIARGRFTRLDLSFVGLIGASIGALVWMTFVVASYAQAKAFYVMVLALPICYFAAMFLIGKKRLSAVRVGAMAAGWVMILPAMFLVVPSGANRSVWAVLADGRKTDDAQRLMAVQREVVMSDPGYWPARIALARMLLNTPAGAQRDEEVARLIDAAGITGELASTEAKEPQWPERLAIYAQLKVDSGEVGEGIELLKLSLMARPGREQRWIALVEVLKALGQAEEAKQAARQGMVYFPWSAELGKTVHGR